MPVSVGTDPNLTLKTRRGTGYYKVPSLRRVVPQHVRAQRLVRDARRLARPAPHPRRLCPDRLQAIRREYLRSERSSLRARPERRRQEGAHRVLEDLVARWIEFAVRKDCPTRLTGWR